MRHGRDHAQHGYGTAIFVLRKGYGAAYGVLVGDSLALCVVGYVEAAEAAAGLYFGRVEDAFDAYL